MTRIAFAADLHVDAYGHRIDPATGLNARLVDYLDTTAWTASRARAMEAEALVVAGDFTERRHPAAWLVSKIADALQPGPDRQVFVRGNHDGEIAGGSIVTVLARHSGAWTGVSRPQIVRVGDVAVCCIPHADRHWVRAQPGFESVPDAEVFAVIAQQLLSIARGLYVQAQEEGATATVLVLHQTLAGAHLSESQQAFLGDQQVVLPVADLTSIGYEGIVAGHLHRHQVLDTAPPVLYAGSIERVDFGEEGEDKGFVVADVGPGRFEWQFVETPARRYLTLVDPTIAECEAARDAIVRVRLSDPAADIADIRRFLEEAGVFEVHSITVAPVEAAPSSSGFTEGITPEQALEQHFADDPDREALVERGRGILAEVAA